MTYSTTAPSTDTATPVLSLGGIDAEVQRLLRQLPLPLLTDGDHYTSLLDGLEFAADMRQGVVALGPGDSGKSVALAWAVDEFARSELKLRRHDAAYRPRRAVMLNVGKLTTGIDLFSTIYRVAFDTDPGLRVRGAAKKASELLRDLMLRLREEDVAVVVLDDADALSAELLALIAGLMAVATDEHPERLVKSDAGATAVIPQGVGIVLCGTARLEASLFAGSEIGNAWKTLVRVGLVAADTVPHAMRQLLPTWSAAATAMGDDAWAMFVREHVSYSRHMPIGALDTLARLYVRRAFFTAMEVGRVVQRCDDIPWDAPLLAQVRKEVLVPASTFTRGFDMPAAA